MIMPTAAEVRMAKTNAQRIADCRMGDVDAFGLIYVRDEQALFRHAYNLIGQREKTPTTSSRGPVGRHETCPYGGTASTRFRCWSNTS